MKKPKAKKAANKKPAKKNKAQLMQDRKERATKVSTPTLTVPMVGDKELLKLACEFDLGPEPISNGRYKWWERYPREAHRNHIYIKNMGNPNKDDDPNAPDRWGIFREGMSSCLNKDGEWQHQGLPSSRPNDFYDHCRYASVHEAIAYYRRWYTAIAKWAEEKMAAAPDKDKLILNWDECPNIPKFQQEKPSNGRKSTRYDDRDEGEPWQAHGYRLLIRHHRLYAALHRPGEAEVA